MEKIEKKRARKRERERERMEHRWQTPPRIEINFKSFLNNKAFAFSEYALNADTLYVMLSIYDKMLDDGCNVDFLFSSKTANNAFIYTNHVLLVTLYFFCIFATVD